MPPRSRCFSGGEGIHRALHDSISFSGGIPMSSVIDSSLAGASAMPSAIPFLLWRGHPPRALAIDSSPVGHPLMPSTIPSIFSMEGIRRSP